MTTAGPSVTIRQGLPLVTVIIPCYGEGRYLDDCIESVRRQTYAQLEILVIDDAGHDDAVAIALEHALVDPRVQVVRTTTNVGLGAIRNAAIASARGELLQFLDGDDMLTPDAVRLRVRRFARLLKSRPANEHARIAGVYGHWHYVHKGADLSQASLPSERLGAIDETTSRGGNIFTVSAPLVRTDIMRSTGGFAEGVNGGEDLLAWRRVLATGAVFFATQTVVHLYRQKHASMLRLAGEQVSVFAAASREHVTDQATLPEATTPVPIEAGLGSARLRKTHAGDYILPWGTPRRQRTRPAGLHLEAPTSPPSDTGEAAPLTWSTNPPEPRPTNPRLAHDFGVAASFLDAGNPAKPSPDGVLFRVQAPSTVTPTKWPLATPRTRTGEQGAPSPDDQLTLRAETEAEGVVAAGIALARAKHGTSVTLAVNAAARRGALSTMHQAPELLREVTLATLGVSDPEGQTEPLMTPGNLALTAATFPPLSPPQPDRLLVVFDVPLAVTDASAIAAAAESLLVSVVFGASSSSIARTLSDGGLDVRPVRWHNAVSSATAVASCGGIARFFATLFGRPWLEIDSGRDPALQITGPALRALGIKATSRDDKES